MLAVAARGSRTDGRSSGIASDSGPESTTGYVWSDAALCAYGAGPTELSPPPSVGWHFAAHVVQRAG